MSESLKELIKKAIKFFFTSGLGFIIDFIVYTFLTLKSGFGVLPANCISSLLGASFVFIVSTSRIFKKKEDGIPLSAKYAVYIIYQLMLIFFVSWLGSHINNGICSIFKEELILHYSKLLSKVIITPFTMICNFIVTKTITEKI